MALQYANLRDIFKIPEKPLSEDMLDFTWLSHDQKIEKRKQNVKYSIQDRRDELLRVQYQNKLQRLKMLTRAKEDKYVQEMILKKCERDPLFFFNMLLWTYNPRLDKPHLPFIFYPYQEESILDLIESIEKGIDHRYEKSRDMWFSRVILWVLLRWWLFKWWASLIWSYKEDYVDMQWSMDSSFERIRYMISRLPKRMVPDDMVAKFMSISSKKIGAEIWGDAWKNFGTWWRRKVVFLDEFALWENDETALRKTKDLTECRIFWWTPEWINNVYGQVMTNQKKYRHLMIKKTRWLRDKHPFKTQVRYQYQKATRTSLDLAKEVDISYETSVSGAVYSHFTTMAIKGEFKYDYHRKTYWSRDFGLDMTAFTLRQKDFQTWSLYLIKAFQRKDWDLRDFAWLVKGKPCTKNNFVYSMEDMDIMDFMQHVKFSNHFWDPYNSDSRNVTDKQNTIRKTLMEEWIYVQTRRNSTLKDRIAKTQLWLNRVFYNSDQIERQQAMIQSHYPQVKEWSESTVEKDKPVHDENSHFRTSTEYFFDNEPMHDSDWYDDGGITQDVSQLY